ncbi:hypothetical protein K1T71_007571 [Dendrolimus kikuchii]|uniref:Uncharacterized protein n=1 Tax=Dendrolimus kikuchii TaxID=765133 RepID=A0ACC1CZ32_9NEOP|nr:hypothetical protein K1T71_007571 [Dendrolimus kikuchii]
MATTAYEHDADGCKFIPATQRPDGTWRKPRRIREGYVPQEEVPLYESKGKQFKARQNTGLPVGLTPEIVAEAQKSRRNNAGAVQPIPGMLVNVDKKKKKKKTGIEEVADKIAKCEIIEPSFENTPPMTPNATINTDPTKRIKNLRKKLRDIEILEEKIKSGTLKNPDKDQKEKMAKKKDIVKEIEQLELSSV